MINLKDKANKLKLDIPAVYISLKKKETPYNAKVFALITIIYALSPIDLIPDFIPLIGFIDDLIVLPILIAITVKLIPQDIFNQCKIESENIWNNGKPKIWCFSIPIILIWITIAILITKKLFPLI